MRHAFTVRSLRLLAPALIVFLVLAAGSAAIAQGQSSTMFYACEGPNGTLSQISTSEPTCNGNQTLVSWNQVGPTGPAGPQGLQGAMGDIGLTGPQGEKGDTGETGRQGESGETGPVGPQGEKGDKGDQGDIGPQGLKGDRGDPGPTNVIVRSSTHFHPATSLPRPYVEYCGEGETATGGGFWNDPVTNNLRFLQVYGGRPVIETGTGIPIGWEIMVRYNVDNFTMAIELYVVCASS
ncbi:hypothetical protein BH24CHL1_BH24CHL1_06950 [soil metagenome]